MASPKKAPTTARPPRPRLPEFRAAIAQAEADGTPKEDLVLRLTLKDDADLRRDRSVGLDEIRFVEGRMQFLGVTILAGGVSESALVVGPIIEAPPPEPKPKPKRPRKPAASKAQPAPAA